MFCHSHSFLFFLLVLGSVAHVSALKLKHFQQSQTQTAQVYKGFSQINVPEAEPTQLQYFISFTQYQEGCDFKSCFYGWVNNFTLDKEQSFYGYPKSSEDVEAVFEFKANSKQDFVISRHPKLSDTFVNIIEVGCQLYQPNIKQDSEKEDKDRANYKFIELQQFLKQNPQSLISKDIPKLEGGFAAKIEVPLKIDDVQAKISKLNQQIVIDKGFNIIKRSKIVNLLLPTDSFGEQKQTPNFETYVKTSIDQSGIEPANHEELKKITQKFREFEGNSYTKDDIEKRRQQGNFYKEDIKFNDTITTNPQNEPILNINTNRNFSTFIAPINTSIRPSRFKPAPKCTLTSTPSGQIIIWSYQKLLFQKTILGKKFSVKFKLDAAIVNNNKVRFRGYIVYSLFGRDKSVQVFNYIKDINLNWVKKYDISGNYGASIYVPLPPPVSFLGLNFAFTVGFGVSVSLYAKTNNQIVNCVFSFQVGADVGTQVNVDASAAVRAIAIQGGVYIGGTLVSLSTDPKLAIAFNLQTKVVVPKITWYFYIKAFKFEWGFFYRYWRLLKGWSSKKIIAKWPISNGVTQTYLVYKN